MTQLWTDKRMGMRWLEICMEIIRSGQSMENLDRTSWEILCREVRDEYELKLCELREDAEKS